MLNKSMLFVAKEGVLLLKWVVTAVYVMNPTEDS